MGGGRGGVTRHQLRFVAASTAFLLLGAGEPPAAGLSGMDAAKCSALGQLAGRDAPVSGFKVLSADWRESGYVAPGRGGQSPPLPAHCDLTGSYGERRGLVGGPYRTNVHMRLPAAWNGRFFFQGGGGSNGVIGDALGSNGPGNRSAIERGYAVLSQDSGHDNAVNKLASHGGDLVFGHDPQARADYGHASLKRSYDLGLYLLRLAYGRDPRTKIFWGCSKGGQEGMAFAQRYPQAFDGIVAAAPGFSLPRAAIAEAWDVRQFASILKADAKPMTLENLKGAITAAQMTLVTDAVRATCDGDDGVKDGIIGVVGQCTSARILPALRKNLCKAGSLGVCLSEPQISALAAIMAGPRNRSGKALYSSWAWDSGMADPGWRVWKVGLENGPPALNVMLGGGSLAAVFTTPPTPLSQDPAALLKWQLAFDFERDAARIYATNGVFRTSAWQDIGMRSSDLSAFRAHGGKLIVPHGVSDPVFSVLDTIGWWNEVNRGNGGRAADFARVFPVPGMNHCAGGPATDQFDSLAALEDWVLKAKAPDAIMAMAGAQTPWPGRTRPLCPYPKVARLAGAGDIDKAGSFTCKR